VEAEPLERWGAGGQGGSGAGREVEAAVYSRARGPGGRGVASRPGPGRRVPGAPGGAAPAARWIGGGGPT